VKLQLYAIYDSRQQAAGSRQQAAEQNSRRFDVNLAGSDDESFN